MRKWFLSFDVACGDLPHPVKGERFSLPSLTIQGDAIDVSRAVRMMAHGEIVPMRQLQYGVDSGDLDMVDVQAESVLQSDEVKPDEVKPDEVKPDEVKPDEVKPDEVKPDEVK